MAGGFDFSTFGYTDTQRKQLDVSKQMQGLQKKIDFSNMGNVGVPEYKPIRNSRGTNFLKGIFNLVDAPRAAIATPMALGMNTATNLLGPAYERSQKASGATGPFAKWPFDTVRKMGGDAVGPMDLFNAFRPSQDNVLWSDIFKSSLGTPQTRKAIDLMTSKIPHEIFNQLDKASGGQGFFGGLSKFGQFMTQPRFGDTSIVGAQSKMMSSELGTMATGLIFDIALDPLMYVNIGGGAVKAAAVFANRFKVGIPFTKTSMKAVAGWSTKLGRVLELTGKIDDPARASDNIMSKFLQIAEGSTKYLDDADNVKLLIKEVNTLGGLDNMDDATRLTKNIIKDIKQLDESGQLFDKAALRVAEWLPEGISGRQIIKRPTAGTFERTVNFGRGKQVTIKVPRSVGIATEQALAKKYPGFKRAIDRLKAALISPKARPFGMEDVGEAEHFLRNIRKYESIKQWDLAQNANYIKERIFDFIRKTGMTIEDQKVIAHTIELAKPTKRDTAMIRKIFNSLMDNYTKGNKNYNSILAKNAGALDIPPVVLQDMLVDFTQAQGKMQGAVVDTLSTHYAMKRFDSAMLTVTRDQRELLWRAKQSLDESWMMMKPAYSKGYVTHIYPSEGSLGQKLTETGRTTTPISAKYTSRLARKYDTLEDAINIGRKVPAEEIGFITAYEKLRTTNAYQTQQFVDETIESFGRRITRRAQAGPHEGVFTDFYTGKTYAMPEFIADSLNKYSEVFISPPSSKAFTKFYDKMIGLWKGYVTATPGFTGRNVLMGNSWAGYSELGAKYFEPQAAKEGVQIFMAQFPEMVQKYPALRGKSTKNGLTYVELAQMAGQQGMFRGQVGYDLMAQMTMYDEFMGMLNGSPSILNKINPANQKNAYLSTFYKINSGAEDISKLIAFNLEMSRLYNDPVSAGIMVKRYFFDYSELSNVERMWMRRAIPFYTWMRKNIPLQIEELILQTGKYKVFPLGKKYIEGLSAGAAPSEQYLPEYMKERYWIRTPKVDKWGNYLYFNPNFPPQDLAMLVNPNEWMSVLSPAIKMPLELAMNRSTFFDSPIKDNQWSLSYAPKWAKAIPDGLQQKLGMVSAQDGTLFMDPTHRYMMDAIPTLKLINRFSQQDEAMKNKSPSLQAQATFLGLKQMPYRYEDEKLNWLYNEKDNMNEYLRMLRKIGVPTSETGGVFE